MKLITNLIGFIFFLFSALCLFSISGCLDSDHPLDGLISSANIEGAITPIKVLNLERQTGKSVEGGQYVQTEISVPFDIKQDQVKPTILSALKEMKKEFPSCHWFVIYLNPSQFKSDRLGSLISVAKGEYTDGQINIDYQLPTSKEALIPLSEKEFKAAVVISATYYPYYKVSRDPDTAYQQTADDLNIPLTTAKELRNRLMDYYGLTREVEVIK